MVIEKNGKRYAVAEMATSWTIKLESGKVTAVFNVSKELCGTETELREYVTNNDMF